MRIAQRRIEAVLDRRLPHWRIERRIQNREKSAVYRLVGRDDETETAILKCLPLWVRSPHSDAEFLRQGGTNFGTITLVKCLEYFEETVMRGTRPIAFILMERWATSLRDHAKKNRPLTPETVRTHLRATLDLSQTLLADTGLIQWDFKPSNVLMSEDGTRSVFGDYGGLAPLEAGPRGAQFTEKFAPPERILDEPSAGIASLAYSIGLTGYWLASGKVPHEAVPVAGRFAVLALHGPGLDRETRERVAPLLPALRRLTARKPGDRPQSLDEIQALLSAAF